MKDIMIADIKRQFEILKKKIETDYLQTQNKIKQIEETMRDL